MYLSVVQVFLPYLSRYMLKVSLIGWGEELSRIPETLQDCSSGLKVLIFAGLPLLVVIVTISVDKDNYGLVPYSKHSDGTSDKL